MDPSGKPITLRSAKGRRWRNEVQTLTEAWGERAFWSRGEDDFFRTPRSRSAKSQLLDILLVSRDFYFSGVAAFFGGNAFCFEGPQALSSMTKTLDSDRRRHIAQVVVTVEQIVDIGPPFRSIHRCEWVTERKPEVFRDVVERLPALKKLTLDFALNDDASARGITSHRLNLRAHVAVLREMIGKTDLEVTLDKKPIEDV